MGDVICIKNAFTPPFPDPLAPFYWFHRGSVDNTSLPGLWLPVVVNENEEVCLVTPGGTGGSGWMGDTGEADFRIYFTNPLNVAKYGHYRWTMAYVHITYVPSDEIVRDEIGVNFNYNTGYYEGNHYELFVRMRLRWKINGIVHEYAPMFSVLNNSSDVLGIRLLVASNGQAEGFYNIDGGSWQSLGTVGLDWWPEKYLGVAYNVGVLQGTSEPVMIDADVEIVPDTLNLKSKGKWITCYIELPEGYDVADIDVGSVFLEDEIEVQRSDVQNGVLMVKFNRQALIEYLDGATGDLTLMVTGELTDGTPFEGSDTITVIDKGKNKESKGMNEKSKGKNKK